MKRKLLEHRIRRGGGDERIWSNRGQEKGQERWPEEDLSSKQGNQGEEEERRDEKSSGVHDLEALLEEAFFLTGAQRESNVCFL